MKVYVRVRPNNNRETDTRTVVRVIDDQILIFDPKEDLDEFFYQGLKQKYRDIRKKQNKDLQFMFDRVFDGNATNEEVYEHTTMPVLDGLLDGCNCSVFAYGATGAGKTFTMLGNPDSPGITFLTMMELFRRIEVIKHEKLVEVLVSYLEVYNENIRDLMTSSNNLQLREDPQRGVIVTGLKMHKPQCAEELLDMLQAGNRRRTQHPTDANSESSRSHAIFTVYLKQQENSGHKVALRSCLSKMSLIDLAGSERATMLSANNRGSRMREGANINKSLLALGNCINALAGRAMGKPHIPYRNSKLTRLLKDSLDGNCYTVMIAAVSPSVNSFDDSYNTLKYADRAKSIQMDYKQNVVNNSLHAIQYVKMIDDLRAQVVQLKAELQLVRGSNAVPSSTQSSLDDVTVISQQVKQIPVPDSSNMSEVSNDAGLKHCLREVFNERHDIQRDYLQVISQMRELELRIQHRLKKVKSLKLVSVDALLLERSTEKADEAVQSMYHRLESLHVRKVALEERIMCNQQKLDEFKITNLPEELKDWVKLQRCEIELKNRKHQNRHLRRLAVSLNHEECRSNQLVASLLCILQRQYGILKVKGLVTSDVEEDYSAFIRQVEGYKGVAWADQQVDDESNTKDDLSTSAISSFTDILDLPLLPLSVTVKDDLKNCHSVIQSAQTERQPFSPLNILNGVGTVDPPLNKSLNAFKKLKLGLTPPRRKSPRLMEPVVSKASQNIDLTFVLSPSLPSLSPLLQQHNSTERRLTFDTPGLSILKVSQEKDVLNAKMSQSNSASIPNQSQVGNAVRKTQPVRQFRPFFKKSNSATSLAKVESLRKHSSTSTLNKPEGSGNSVVQDVKGDTSLRLSGYKMRVPKNLCNSSLEAKNPLNRCSKRIHPYQSLPPQFPQPVKTSDSKMNSSDVPIKKQKISVTALANNLAQQCSNSISKQILLPNQLGKSSALFRQRSHSTSSVAKASLEKTN